MEKIIIIGAGMGGITAAYALSKDFDVIVYEKNQVDELSYDWYDDAKPTMLKNNGIEFENENFYFLKKPWAFVPPFSDKTVISKVPDGQDDYSFQRRKLSEFLVNKALQNNAKFVFGQGVDNLYIDNDKVEGVIVNGKIIKCDLVIDSSGCMSKLRSSLPDSYYIQKAAGKGGLIYTTRYFYDRKSDFTPDYSHKIYLKPLGMNGISWFRCDFEDECDLFVGAVDSLDDEAEKKVLSELQTRNPTVGDKLIKSGKSIIPVRYPLPKMVGEKYVAIGDAAFMTIPLIGSGMANSINAAFMLAEVIKKNGFCVENLWNYQVRYFKEIGTECLGIDAMKRWLLQVKPDDIKFLFESGIIGENEMEMAAGGGEFSLSIGDLLAKLKVGYKKMGLLTGLSKALSLRKAAIKLGTKIPDTYDLDKITKWQNKVIQFFNNI